MIAFPTAFECAYIFDDNTYCKKRIKYSKQPYCVEHKLIMYRTKTKVDKINSPHGSTRTKINKDIQQQIEKRDKGS